MQTIPRRLARLSSTACALLCAALAFADPVPTAVVASARLASSYSFDAVVQAANQSTVSAQASGRIVSFLAKPGDRVRAGQLLATLDDREPQAAASQAQALTRQAASALANARAQAERSRELKAKGFLSQAALDASESQFQSAQGSFEAAGAGARQSALSAGHSRVSAPFDGIVQKTFAQAGDLASPGSPLLLLYAPAPLRVSAQIPSSRNQEARRSKQALVFFDTPGSLAPERAERSLEVPGSDPVSQTVEWRFELSEKAGQGLYPGQRARVELALADPSARALIPSSAIVRRGELTGAYVAEGGGFSLRAARFGADFGALGVEVLAGLRPGERVATDTLLASARGAVPASAPPGAALAHGTGALAGAKP